MHALDSGVSQDSFNGRPTRGLTAFSTIYAGWGVGERWYTDRRFETAGFASVLRVDGTDAAHPEELDSLRMSPEAAMHHA